MQSPIRQPGRKAAVMVMRSLFADTYKDQENADQNSMSAVRYRTEYRVLLISSPSSIATPCIQFRKRRTIDPLPSPLSCSRHPTVPAGLIRYMKKKQKQKEEYLIREESMPLVRVGL